MASASIGYIATAAIVCRLLVKLKYLAAATMNVKPGRYRHYKGKEYLVLGVARHSETEEELVVYRQDYGERDLWVRPKAMFLETVEVGDRQVPRFQYIGEE
jgi:hypothetical protein